MNKRTQIRQKPEAAPVNQRCFLYFDTEREKLRFLAEAVSYRLPRQVKEVIFFWTDGYYPICPRCLCSMDREYMAYCDRCGQRLSWNKFSGAKVRFPRAENHE